MVGRLESFVKTVSMLLFLRICFYRITYYEITEWRQEMDKKIKKRAKEFYHTASRLGLTNQEIEGIILNNVPEPVSFSIGPPYYPGAHYGTVSINDFD